MKITKEDILHVAQLARLNPDPDSLARLADQIGDILAYVETMEQLDTSGVPPMSHAVSLTNAFREDSPGTHLDREEALDCAPERDETGFRVPRVIA